ncbi:MAG: type II toxin-antitoxin system RelE/ParE family toxin [Spirochaetes bacterium]|nr:type II toxin-antitoxin system RelE/ParE family toxin [Spirochaetota bacterium]
MENYNSLSGNRKGQYATDINDQWRICFNWKKEHAYNAEITDYHCGDKMINKKNPDPVNPGEILFYSASCVRPSVDCSCVILSVNSCERFERLSDMVLNSE